MNPGQQPVTHAKGIPASTTSSEELAAVSPLIIPIWRIVSLELFLYLSCHVVCLLMVLFAPGNVPITAPRNGLLWQHRKKESPVNVEYGPFDAFKNNIPTGSSPSHRNQVSADLLISFLLVFTINGFFLALIHQIKDIMESETKTRQVKGVVESTNGKDARTPSNNNTEKRRLWEVNCSELLNGVIVFTIIVLGIIIPVCVISQPANQVRAFGPALVLLTIGVSLCLLHVHGGVRSLQAFLEGFQAVIISALLILILEAKLFSHS